MSRSTRTCLSSAGFYRTLVGSKDETEQKEKNLFELSSDLSAKALKDLRKPNIKVEHPEKLELTNLAKTSASAVKRLAEAGGQ